MKEQAMFSEEDADLRLMSWTTDGQGYVVRGKQGTTIAHRLVIARMFGAAPRKGRFQMVTDHIDGNKLNNRRDNLRLVTRSQNALNSDYSRNAKHCRQMASGRWIAWLCRKHLGTFDTEADAKAAVEVARLKAV